MAGRLPRWNVGEWKVEDIKLTNGDSMLMVRRGIALESLASVGSGASEDVTAPRGPPSTISHRDPRHENRTASISEDALPAGQIEERGDRDGIPQTREAEGSDEGAERRSNSKRKRGDPNMKGTATSMSRHKGHDRGSMIRPDSLDRLETSVTKRHKTSPETDDASHTNSPSLEKVVTPHPPPIGSQGVPSTGKFSLNALFHALNNSASLPTERYL